VSVGGEPNELEWVLSDSAKGQALIRFRQRSSKQNISFLIRVITNSFWDKKYCHINCCTYLQRRAISLSVIIQ
jgi:hypothetical protein